MQKNKIFGQYFLKNNTLICKSNFFYLTLHFENRRRAPAFRLTRTISQNANIKGICTLKIANAHQPFGCLLALFSKCKYLVFAH